MVCIILFFLFKHLGREDVQVGIAPGVVGQAGLEADGAQKLVAVPTTVAGYLGQEQADAEFAANQQPVPTNLYFVWAADGPEGGSKLITFPGILTVKKR